jgi:uncharacterized protein involved in exopolysaccharide biosynthesis
MNMLKFDHDPLNLDPEPLKFDLEKPLPSREKRPRKRRGPQIKRSDYRAYYDDWAVRTLRSIVRQRWLIVSFVGLALALACITIPVLPRKYTAEALIYPNLFSRDEGKPGQAKVVAVASVDAAAFVTGEARLIRSDAILRGAAKRIGQDPNATWSRSWAMRGLDWVRGTFLPETRRHSPFDRAVALLRSKIVVTNDSRSYLISVSFTALSPDEAARVANAVVIEYFRDKVVQRNLERVNAAEAQLGQQLAVYGDKHPKTLQAVAELDAARASFEAAKNPQGGDQDEIPSDQDVKLAVPNQTPTSPRGFVILGLSFLSALLAGIGLAIWRDRKEVQPERGIVNQTEQE